MCLKSCDECPGSGWWKSLKACVVLPRRITQRSVTQQQGATTESNKEFENVAFNALSEETFLPIQPKRSSKR
jgi:hypothetical protein